MFRNANVVLKVLIGWYLFFWLVMAIAPVSRFDWVVQNITPFVFACALIGSYRRF